MFKNLTLALAVSLLFLAGFEGYLRFVHARERRAIEARYPNRELYVQRARDRRLIYTLTPNRNSANSRGYRDYDYSSPKGPGTKRIVVIGDSVAQGWNVEIDEGFGKVLERRLNELPNSTSYEVVVLARQGYSTSQELVLIEDEAFTYEPDLILWSYCLNDPAHPYYHNANGELGRYFHRPRLYVAHWVGKRWFHLKQRIRGRRCPKEFHKYVHCAFAKQVERGIRRIGELTREHGVPAVFQIHPVFEERAVDFSTYSLEYVHDDLARLAEKAGLIPIDLLDALAPYPLAEIKQSRDDWYDPWHPNAEGHRVIGEYLFEQLVARGLI